MEFDENGIGWSAQTLHLAGEKLKLVEGRGDVWVCCRCGRRGVSGDEPCHDVDPPIVLFVGEEEEGFLQCDLCLTCFQELGIREDLLRCAGRKAGIGGIRESRAGRERPLWRRIQL